MNPSSALNREPFLGLSSQKEMGITPCITAEQLTLTYGERAAFQNVSITIPRGAITAIVGPSGSGKTSFLMCVNRLTDLLSSCRVSGRLLVEGEDILSKEMDVLHLRQRVGMIFQKPNPFPFSIRKNLEFPLKEHGVKNPEAINGRIHQALTDVGLWQEVKNRLDAPAQTLSGGQQQRLCLARALVLSPTILLLDEPCSALDPLSSGVIEDLVLSFRGRYTVVMVTHNLAQARRLADCVGVFWYHHDGGHLIEHGPVRQIFESPRDPLTVSYINGRKG